MRGLTLGLALLILICFAPCVAAQPSWGIKNKESCPNQADYTLTDTYVCIVEWYVELPPDCSDVKVVVSLIDLERGEVLVSEEYFVQHGNRLDETTRLTMPVPRFHTLLLLRVDMTVEPISGGIWLLGASSSDYYELKVEVVPEFPAAAPVLLMLLILAIVLTRKTKRIKKYGQASAAPPHDGRSSSP